MNTKQNKYNNFAYKLVTANIGVKRGEQILIVCDTNTDMQVAYALADAVDKVGGEYTISIMPARPADKCSTTTDIIAKSAEAADVIISLTRYNSCALFDSRVNRLMRETKLRDVALSCRDCEMFLRGGALADYEQILQDGIKLRKVWETKKTFRITSKLGTDLSGEIGSFPVLLGCGIAREPGEGMAFPDGEVSCTPNDGTVNGTIIVDGPIFSLRNPESPVKLTVKDSSVISIDGSDAEIVTELRRILAEVEHFDWLAEIAIGLNPASLRNGQFSEEKKAYGNVHIAMGDNVYYSGTNACAVHMDFVITNCTVTMDDELVLDHGKITVI